jgi:hypothetical protein
MVPEFNAEGLLPCGRFVATAGEVEAALVKADLLAASSTRSQVWADFLAVVDLIRDRRVKVPAAFVSGSFVTNRLDPEDVDASVIIDVSRVTNPKTIASVQSIVANTRTLGLNVDAFLIHWFPDGTEHGRAPAYWEQRGHWDDFWQRYVPNKQDRDFPQRAHAMPKRGYLEVILDGYR